MISAIAQVCHAANREWCAINGDASQAAWEDAAEWQRESAVKGVIFAMENPDASPAVQHTAWAVNKFGEGWKWGPVKDAEAKTHPCLVPFEQLPKHQQVKDELFRAIVKAIAG